jgi:hypothetical protein
MTMLVIQYLKALVAGMIASGLASVVYLVVMTYSMTRGRGAGMIDFPSFHDPRFALLISVAFALGMFLALRFIIAPSH